MDGDGGTTMFLAAVLVLSAVLFAALVRRTMQPRRVVLDHGVDCTANAARLDVIGGANVAMVVRARIGRHDTAFVVDTGFAGPPLLSLPLLAMELGVRQSADEHHRLGCTLPTVRDREQQAALQSFLSANACVSFTAGCSVNLLGIGGASHVTADTILAPPMQFMTPSGELLNGRTCAGLPAADVLTTTPMPTTHILTLDWMRQVAPCCIMPSAGEMRIGISPLDMLELRPQFASVTREMSGGAFVARVRVGGVTLRATVDTGATVFVALGATAAKRITRCRAGEKPAKVEQKGVNGERVCSEVVHTDVEFAGAAVADVPVYMNSHELGDVDAYVGAALLRGFDLLVMPDELLARRNGAIDMRCLDGNVRGGGCGKSGAAIAHCKRS